MTPLSALLILMIYSTMLVPIIAFTYSYDSVTGIASGACLLVLLAVDIFLWLYRGRMSRQGSSFIVNRGITAGLAIGLLWVVEISINNFMAPPLPARDMIDNLFWAAIALLIFALSIVCAYRTGRIKAGVEAGIWSGFASGALACCMALSLIVFGMRFMTQDPINIAEWANRGPDTTAPTMVAYFAFETLAGAFLHLAVLGLLMGLLLGLLGGAIGKGVRVAANWM
jgi:hypothetical protein